MAFSIKNIFQRGAAGEPDAAGGRGGSTMPMGGSSLLSPPPQQGGDQPPGFGNSLFRAVGDNLDGAPVAPPASPFSAFGAASTSTTLTVADILPQLPPDVARPNGAAPDQPVALSPQVIEAAISSGQLAVPIFEVFRVCPALFQTPPSPNDPRMVPLPKGKLPGMIATHTGALKPQSPPPSQEPSPFAPAANGASPFMAATPLAASPFAVASQGGSPFAPMPQAPNAAASPFAPALPDLPASQPMGQGAAGTSGVRPAGSLPPRRPPGTPPSIPTQADFVGAAGTQSPFVLPQAPQDGGGAAPSPFAALSFGPQSTPAPQPAMGGGPLKSQSLLFGSQQGGVDPELEAAPPTGPAQAMGQPFAAPPMNSSPFAAAAPAQPLPFTPFGQSGASPFLASPQQEPPPATPDAPSPFLASAPLAVQPAPSPFLAQPPQQPTFEVPAMPAAPEQNAPAPLTPQAQQAMIRFTQPAPSHAAAGPAARTIRVMPTPGMAPASPLPPPEEMIEVSLAAVLRGHSPQELGFDATFLPAWITSKLPASNVHPQLASGTVMIDLGTIIDGTDATFRTVIAHGNRDVKVSMSASEVFGKLVGAPAAAPTPLPAPLPAAPTFAPAPQAAPALQPMSSFMRTQPLQPQMSAPSPLAHFAATPTDSLPSPAPAAQPPVSQPFALPAAPTFASPPQAAAPAHTFAPAPVAPSMDWAMPKPAPAPEPAAPSPVPFNEGFGSAQLFGSAAPEPPAQRPMTRPLTVPSAAMQATSVFSSGDLHDDPLEQFMPVMDASRTPSKPLSKPVSQPAQAPSHAGQSFGITPVADDGQMMMRALLGTSDSLSTQRVVELVSRIPGVAACVNVRGLKLMSHGDSSQPSMDFRQQAPEIARSLRTLAGVIGMEAETLSIAAGERLITFCFQGENAFGVLHTDKEPPPGLRDKVTLISREVSRLPA